METLQDMKKSTNADIHQYRRGIEYLDRYKDGDVAIAANKPVAEDVSKPNDRCDLTDANVAAYLDEWRCNVNLDGMLISETTLYTYDFLGESFGVDTILGMVRFLLKLRDVINLCIQYMSSLTELSGKNNAVFAMWSTPVMCTLYAPPKMITPIERLLDVCIAALNYVGVVKPTTQDMLTEEGQVVNDAKTLNELTLYNIHTMLEIIDLFMIRNVLVEWIQDYVASPTDSWVMKTRVADNLGQYRLIIPSVDPAAIQGKNDVEINQIIKEAVEKEIEDLNPSFDRKADRTNYHIIRYTQSTDVGELLDQLEFIHGDQSSSDENVQSAGSPLVIVCKWMYSHLVYLNANPKARTIFAKKSDVPILRLTLQNASATTSARMQAFKEMRKYSFEPENVALLCDLLNRGNVFLMYDGLTWLWSKWLDHYDIERADMSSADLATLDNIVTKAFDKVPGSNLDSVVSSYRRMVHDKRTRWYTARLFMDDLEYAVKDSVSDPLLDRLLCDWVSWFAQSVQPNPDARQMNMERTTAVMWFGELSKSAIDKLKEVIKRNKGAPMPGNLESLLTNSRGLRFQAMSIQNV